MQFIGFAGILVCGLGLLLYYKGGRIQKIVLKNQLLMILVLLLVLNLFIVLYYFILSSHSQVPMSTTWVFIGLLGGRELYMALRRSGQNSIFKTFKLIFKDFSFA